MTNFRMLLAGLGMLAQSVPVLAQGGYWGIGISTIEVEDEIGDSVEPTNLYGHVGYDFNRHIGLESQASFTLANDSFEGVDWYTSLVGFYLKAGVPVSDSIDLYVLGGYSSVELTADLGFGYVSDDESGFSYGVGADLSISDDMAVFVRNMTYLEEDGLFSDVSALNIGVGWSF